MAEVLCSDMVLKNQVSSVFNWWVSYDYKSLEICPDYEGEVVLDYYGRLHPRHSNGTVRMRMRTNSVRLITEALLPSFDAKTDHRLLYRRLGVCACDSAVDDGSFQLDLFTDYARLAREDRIQRAMLEVRRRYGAGAVFKGINLLEGATTLERNRQIGGHRA
jgi:DNA polymerase V